MAQCRRKTEWGRCQQEADAPRMLCSLHLTVDHKGNRISSGRRIDRYYHEKVSKGLVVPITERLSESELEAVVNGRYRGDGRRLDQYTLPDPLFIDLEAL